MEKHTHDHHQRDKHNQHTNPDEDHFFHSLAEKLRDGDKILLMGPGMAKKHFMTHLQTKHHHGLDAKVVGVENADHPTDNQILEIARKFFHTYNLFHT
jgi:stalled ribosome rescue protein Dom34